MVHRIVPFDDRVAGGRALAKVLAPHVEHQDAIVLGVPRGGVVVAHEVAASLGLPLDILVAMKLGDPNDLEVAMGAIASGGVAVFNEDLVQGRRISAEDLREVEAEESKELERREQMYRGDRPMPRIENRVVILVDDGLATGATMRASVEAVRRLSPAKVIAAAPVASQEAHAVLAGIADECICAIKPYAFTSVGKWYRAYDQTSDNEVCKLLGRAWRNTDSVPVRRSIWPSS